LFGSSSTSKQNQHHGDDEFISGDEDYRMNNLNDSMGLPHEQTPVVLEDEHKQTRMLLQKRQTSEATDDTDSTCSGSSNYEEEEEEVVIDELYLMREAARLHLSTIAMQIAMDSSNKADILISCVCNKPFCSAVCLLVDDERSNNQSTESNSVPASSPSRKSKKTPPDSKDRSSPKREKDKKSKKERKTIAVVDEEPCVSSSCDNKADPILKEVPRNGTSSIPSGMNDHFNQPIEESNNDKTQKEKSKKKKKKGKASSTIDGEDKKTKTCKKKKKSSCKTPTEKRGDDQAQ